MRYIQDDEWQYLFEAFPFGPRDGDKTDRTNRDSDVGLGDELIDKNGRKQRKKAETKEDAESCKSFGVETPCAAAGESCTSFSSPTSAPSLNFSRASSPIENSNIETSAISPGSASCEPRILIFNRAAIPAQQRPAAVSAGDTSAMQQPDVDSSTISPGGASCEPRILSFDDAAVPAQKQVPADTTEETTVAAEPADESATSQSAFPDIASVGASEKEAAAVPAPLLLQQATNRPPDAAAATRTAGGGAEAAAGSATAGRPRAQP